LDKFTFDPSFRESIHTRIELPQAPPRPGTNRANDRALVGSTSLCEKDCFKSRDITVSIGEIDHMGRY
jgi:hypothetical protein